MHFYTNVYRYRDYILARGYRNGKPFTNRLKYQPTFYVSTNKPSAFKSIHGHNLEPKKFPSKSASRAWREKYDNIGGFEVHGLDRFEYTYINENFTSDIEFDFNQIKILNLDIECECEEGFPEPLKAEERVNAISMKLFGHDTIYVFGIDNHDYQTNDPNVKYYKCQHEKHLLLTFLDVWEQICPDVVTGWNVLNFDVAYLVNRMKKLFDEETVTRLSPHRIITSKNWKHMGQQDMVDYNLAGIEVLDYQKIFRYFTYTNQESYRLDHIAEVTIGQKKLDYSEFGAMHLFYKHDYNKFLDYNVRDVVLVEKIDDKLKLMNLLFNLAYSAKCNYSDTFGQVKFWDLLIYNFLRKKNVVPPPKVNTGDTQSFAGAYVKEPQVGLHEWVMSFDLNSLYPHLIMQYNISPETHHKEKFDGDITVNKLLKEEVDINLQNLTVTPNGSMFDTTSQGYLPELLEELYDERVYFKNKMIESQKQFEKVTDPKEKKRLEYEITANHNNQLVRKICLNSAYGAIGNQWFRYYNRDMAEAITTAGQLSIKWVEKAVNEFLNKVLKTDNKDYVIAIDTDSIYVTFEELIKQVNPKGDKIDFLNRTAKEAIEPVIEECYEKLAKYVFAYKNKMRMGREVIADKGIWTAKKRYILNVFDSEGVRYNEPHLKTMGIETVKSSTPQWCRGRLKEALKVVMKGSETDVQNFIQETKEDFNKLSAEDIAFPRGVQKVTRYKDNAKIYKKSTPIHVRGSLLYNHYLNKYNIEKKYPVIQNGEKIKFCYLKVPNIMNENVISFVNALPKEFKLENYIDYDTQFNKAFLEPLELIIEKIGWHTEPQSNLELFFG